LTSTVFYIFNGAYLYTGSCTFLQYFI